MEARTNRLKPRASQSAPTIAPGPEALGAPKMILSLAEIYDRALRSSSDAWFARDFARARMLDAELVRLAAIVYAF